MSIPSIFSDEIEPSLAFVTLTQDWRVKLTAADEIEFINTNTATSVLKLGPTGNIVFGNAFTFPSSDGTSGQILRTDGAGNLTFVSAGSGDLISANNLNDVANIQVAIDNLTKTSTVEVDQLVLADHGANSQMWVIEEDSAVTTNALTFDYNGVERLRMAPNGTMTFGVTGIIKGFNASGEGNPSGGLTILGGTGDSSVGGTITVQGGTGSLAGDGGDVLIVPGIAGESGNTGSVVIDGLTWPATDGTNGQTVTTDGSGNLSFGTVSSVGSLTLSGSLTVGGAALVALDNVVNPGFVIPPIAPGPVSFVDVLLGPPAPTAIPGNSIVLGFLSAPPPGLMFNAFVVAPGTITVRIADVTGAGFAGAPLGLAATILHF